MYNHEIFIFSKSIPNLFIDNISEQEYLNSEYNIPNDEESSINPVNGFVNYFNMNTNLYLVEHSDSSNLNFPEKAVHQDFNSIFTNTFSNNIFVNEKDDNKNEFHLIKTLSNHENQEPSYDCLNIKTKRTKKPLFYVDNDSDKFGNNIKEISGRKDNLRSKILRQFFQNVIYKWITNKDPEKKDKLNSKKLEEYIKSLKSKKSKKLSEIYEFSELKKDEIIKIKLNFTLEQVFKCFAKPDEERSDILSFHLKQMQISSCINEDEFFSGLNVHKYINWLIKKGSSPTKIHKVLENILNEFDDSGSLK